MKIHTYIGLLANKTTTYCKMVFLWFTYIVDGGWSDWKDISQCFGTCGEGVKVQSRSCSEPPMSCNGKHCNGSDLQLVACNVSSCCPGLLKYLQIYSVMYCSAWCVWYSCTLWCVFITHSFMIHYNYVFHSGFVTIIQ